MCSSTRREQAGGLYSLCPGQRSPIPAAHTQALCSVVPFIFAERSSPKASRQSLTAAGAAVDALSAPPPWESSSAHPPLSNRGGTLVLFDFGPNTGVTLLRLFALSGIRGRNMREQIFSSRSQRHSSVMPQELFVTAPREREKPAHRRPLAFRPCLAGCKGA